MPTLPGKVFAALLLVIAGVFIYFHFHAKISIVSSALIHRVKVAQDYISPTATSNNYTVAVKRGGAQAAYPGLPDISMFTTEQVAAQAPAFVAGKVSIAGMVGLPGAREFIKKDGRVQRLRLSQMAVTPQVIYIEEGHYNFTHLYDEVKLLSQSAIEKRGTQYLLRLPILVGEGASLTISDSDTSEILLSQDQNVFIANAGDLFIIRIKVTGWNEKNNAPSFFVDKTVYRPFLVSWSGARMYIAGSNLAHLGYRKGKSYGITYSSCDPCLQVRPDLGRPTGSIVNSTFTGLYFGFYSYEADDIAIVGNTYMDNIIYGIDPHDRSRRLIIAKNETSGSGKKHGIIISREVNDSWIFDNYSHHNHGSGIMIDRTSENNVIANNISTYNEGDGLTFFESPNNTVYNNKIYNNGMSGIRIRNSWNIKMINDQIADNGSIPIVLYSSQLEETQKERDFKEDPYSKRADAIIDGAVIKLQNGRAAIKIDGIDSLTLSNVRLLSGGTVFSDRMFADEMDISENMAAAGKMVTIEKKQPLTKLSLR